MITQNSIMSTRWLNLSSETEAIDKLPGGKITMTREKCPGAIPENDHFLAAVGESERKICINSRCYFMYIDENKVGVWTTGFDPLSAKSFLKPKKEDKP